MLMLFPLSEMDLVSNHMLGGLSPETREMMIDNQPFEGDWFKSDVYSLGELSETNQRPGPAEGDEPPGAGVALGHRDGRRRAAADD
jgi:hypothetical protein